MGLLQKIETTQIKTDRPDLRYELPLVDLRSAAAGSGFAPFDKALAEGGVVRGLRVPAGGRAPRFRLRVGDPGSPDLAPRVPAIASRREDYREDQSETTVRL